MINLNLRDPQGPATKMGIRSGDQITVAKSSPGIREYIVPVTAVAALALTVSRLLE
jgi:hypothetical protein